MKEDYLKLYTSDPHFGHRNIINMCNRPFSSIEEMDDTLIKNWNKAASPNDEVYCLGDFAFHRNANTLNDLFQKLNGEKHLIIGNHDGPEVINLPWMSVQHYLEIIDQNTKLVLFHYGIRSWNGMYKGALHLFGHSHSRLPGNSMSLDAGVDNWNYTPVTLKEIKAKMATLSPAIFEDSNGSR